MATAKKAITFYASAEVLDWYNSLPDGEGSRSINELLLKAIKHELEDRESAKEIDSKINNLEESQNVLSAANVRLDDAVNRLQATLRALEAKIESKAPKQDIVIFEVKQPANNQSPLNASRECGDYIQAHDYAPVPAHSVAQPVTLGVAICPHGFKQSECLSCFWNYQFSK